MRVRISDIVSYEQIREEIMNRKDEYQFYYKNKILNIYSRLNGTYSYNIVENDVVLVDKEFNDLDELLNDVEIDNIKFPKLWYLVD